jgi:hypothetical protein
LIYLLDANAYINAKNLYYRMEFCPGFWEWLDQSFETGQVYSIGMVKNELSTFGDQLSDWVKDRPDHFLAADDEATQLEFAQIVQFVMEHPVYTEPNRSSFLRVADPLLIAKAKTMGATVVTHESLVPGNSTKVKIPNICREFGVEYCSTFELLESLHAQFVLQR